MSSFNLGGVQGILTLTIKDATALYAAYMPFVENRGLFIPTNKKYSIGSELFVLLSLIDQPEKIPVSGTVVWISPKGVQGKRSAGIGVQFSENDTVLIDKIETYLVGIRDSGRPTHTM